MIIEVIVILDKYPKIQQNHNLSASCEKGDSVYLIFIVILSKGNPRYVLKHACESMWKMIRNSDNV